MDPEKPIVLLLGPTGISAANTGGTTIHSGPAIKPGKRLLGIKDKSKVALRYKLSEVKLLILDGIKWFMDRYWLDVGRNIFDNSWKSICFPFSYGCSWLAPVPLVRGKLISFQFSDKDSMKHLLGLQLWIYLNMQN